MVELAAGAAAVLFLGVIGFQIAVAAGAPLGQYTQGGQHTGRLPTGGRLVAAVSAVVLAAMAAVVLGVASLGPLAGWSAGLVRALWWVTVGFLALGVVANLATRSAAERRVFAPVSVALLVLTLIAGA